MKLLPFLTIVLLGLILSPTMAQNHTPNSPALITVTGKAEVFATPDEVHFTIEIYNEGEDLVAAKQENAAMASKAIKYLKSEGVAEKHIQTQYINVSVQYRDRDRLNPRYTARQSISVCLKEVDKFEAVNIGLLEIGITGINGPNFKSTREDELLETVRLDALKDAKKKAEALAAAVGQKIGPAYSITDVDQNSGGNLVYARAMAMDSAESSGPGIALGEIKISHQLTAAFYLYN